MNNFSQYYNPIFPMEPSVSNINHSPPQNRFIYVKQNFNYPKKVLINPHFKPKVFINPKFKPECLKAIPTTIHVNPNILRSLANLSKPTSDNDGKTTVISTRTKIVRLPRNNTNVTPTPIYKRRDSVHTRYKIIRSNSNVKSTSKDKRVDVKKNVNKRKFVYFDRFLTSNVIAKNFVFKQKNNFTKTGFVKINGILYKKSPNCLKKEPLDKTIKTRYKIKRISKTAAKLPGKVNRITQDKSIVKKYKIIRSKKLKITSKPSKNKLRKCNIPCPIYRKFGKCKGKENGTCIKLHNSNQIALCPMFLQGACLKKKCLLSHKVSLEKMPACKYYLEGCCTKDDCPYLHVKISPKAEICRDFIEGFCGKGAECDKRHQYLCPTHEKTGSCPKRRCPYPHSNSVRKPILRSTFAKKSSKKIVKQKDVEIAKIESININRYYDENKDCENVNEQEPPVNEQDIPRFRPQLGDLPSYIPLMDGNQ